MNSEYWKGRRVLVTGHTGFKGSWLCMWLDMAGAEVCGYALEPPTDPSLYELARVDELIDSTIGDVNDLSKLRLLIGSFAPEVILHMAAQSVVLEAYTDPVATYRSNVMGTVHVLDAVRTAARPCVVVNVTTDKVYENTGLEVAYREEDRLGGKDPYSNSKACSELVTSAYRNSFFPVDALTEHGVSVSVARAGNVIGGGDWTPWQLIPDIAQAFSQGKPVELRRPEATRPWQHVLDCLCGYITLAEKQYAHPEEFSGEWNFGPDEGEVHSVRYVVEAFARQWGVSDAWTSDKKAYAHEEPVLQLDSRKSIEQLGWRPGLPIETAIAWVADWYRRHFDGSDARELCLQQIRDYQQLGGASSRQ
jgi:CDP-glucose 4,6-dehydratase